MKNLLCCKPTIALVIIFSISMFAFSQSNSDRSESLRVLNSDPVKSAGNNKVSNLQFYFSYESDTLLGRILMSYGNNNPTVIFLHGNPGFEKNEDIGKMLFRGGFNSVFFSYPGTWGNNGIFNYENACKSTETLINFLKRNYIGLRIDTTNMYIVGHSMGTDIGMIIGDHVKGVICIDPWIEGFELIHH